jgi:O-antigen ligase
MNDMALRLQERLSGWSIALLGSLLALVLVLIPWPVGMVLASGIIFVLAVVHWPFLLPLGLILSVPLQDVLRFSLGGMAITTTQAFILLAILLGPLIVLRRQIRLFYPGIAVATTVLIAIQVLSLGFARNTLYGVATIYRWTAALLVFLLIIHLVESRRSVVVLAVGLVVAALGEVAFGILQSGLGLAPASFAIADRWYRAYGTFGQPNPFAGYLEMVGLWLAALAVWSARLAQRLWVRYRRVRLRGFLSSGSTRRAAIAATFLASALVAGATASLSGIVLSFSRGAWLGTSAGLAIFVLLVPRGLRRSALVIGAIVLAVLAAGGWNELPAAVRERMTLLVSYGRPFDVRDVQLTDANWAIVERMAHWQAAWAMFLDHPLTGVGAGNFSVHFPDYSPHPLFRIARGHAHNYYLHILAELGIPGLLAYLAIFALALLLAVRVWRTRPNEFDRALAAGAFAVTTAVMVHNLVENLHELHLSMQLFSVWALVWRAQAGWGTKREAV